MAVDHEHTAAGLWAAASALTPLALVYTASFAFVGVLIAIPMFLWLGRHASPGRARHGALLGAAMLPAWLAWYHGDYQPCPVAATDVADGIWQCGGTNPAPFAVAGRYWWLSSQSSGSPLARATLLGACTPCVTGCRRLAA